MFIITSLFSSLAQAGSAHCVQALGANSNRSKVYNLTSEYYLGSLDGVHSPILSKDEYIEGIEALVEMFNDNLHKVSFNNKEATYRNSILPMIKSLHNFVRLSDYFYNEISRRNQWRNVLDPGKREAITKNNYELQMFEDLYTKVNVALKASISEMVDSSDYMKRYTTVLEAYNSGSFYDFEKKSFEMFKHKIEETKK